MVHKYKKIDDKKAKNDFLKQRVEQAEFQAWVAEQDVSQEAKLELDAGAEDRKAEAEEKLSTLKSKYDGEVDISEQKKAWLEQRLEQLEKELAQWEVIADDPALFDQTEEDANDAIAQLEAALEVVEEEQDKL